MQRDVAQLRHRILQVAASTGEGHVPSALSILDIVHTLYAKILTSDDLFLLSKGHGCLALYAVLEAVGSPIDLNRFCASPNDLLGHPERGKGSIATTGSLGHGLPMAAGLALAKRLRAKGGRVFCLVGDGECEEGSIWEAAHIAARLKLGNLVCIVDANKSSPNKIDEDMFSTDLCSKFAAFGWHTSRTNGHVEKDIERVLLPVYSYRPVCVVFNTVKGKGVAQMEKDPQAWHRKSPSPEMTG